MPDFQNGAGAALLIGTRDETRLNHNIHLADGREALDITTFQPVDNAREWAYGLMFGSYDSKGFMSDDPDTVNAQMATCSGKNRNDHKIAVAPRGFVVGSEVNFFNTKSGSFGVDVNVSGITTADPAFKLSENGVIDGVCLHTPHGNGTIGQNQKYRITQTDAEAGSVEVTIKDADGNELDIIEIAPGDSSADVEAAFEAVDGIESATASGSTGAGYEAGDYAQEENGGTIASATLNNPEFMFDGDPDTFTTSNGVNDSIIIDLGQSKLINQIVVNINGFTNEAIGGASAAVVDVSDIADFGSAVTQVASYGSGTALGVHTINGTWTKRYVRLRLLHTTGSFAELSINGPGTEGGGFYDVEITDPAITRFILETDSAGWTLTETQQGGDIAANYNIVTDAGSDNWIDGGAQSTEGYSAQLNTIELLGEDVLLSVFVRHTVDDGNGAPNTGAQTTLIAFTAQADKAAEMLRSFTATVKRWVHVTWTLTGTDPQAVFGVAFARH